ncbi:MAG TPA: LacI family DNA-binding transcriptional regulator [Casimicrobiaceae bacterium]|nr:LacI family DNA-binding transcriptional regulator [Casimicrobiaceae bacterium]
MPNSAARSLSTQRSGVIGIVAGSRANPSDMAACEAAQARLAAHGLGMLVAFAGDRRQVEESARAHAARNVDGIVFIGVDPPAVTGGHAGRSLPSIRVGTGQPVDPPLTPEEGVRARGRALILAYLAEYGHRRIGVIRPGDARPPVIDTDDDETNPAIVVRQLENPHDVATIRIAIEELVDQETTAFCLGDDLAAAAALKACRAIGLAVPGDVSIVGWGDSALARCVTPTLSSVRVPVAEMAEAAVDSLLAAIAEESYAWPELPLKLVVRESSGFAPAAVPRGAPGPGST